MVRTAGTHELIIGILRIGVSTGVTNSSLDDSLFLRRRVMLEEDVLSAPEATCAEGSDFYLVHFRVEGRADQNLELGIYQGNVLTVLKQHDRLGDRKLTARDTGEWKEREISSRSGHVGHK